MFSSQTFLIISAVIPSFAIALAGYCLGRFDRKKEPVSYTHLTLPTN
jgi:hypothetical protein